MALGLSARRARAALVAAVVLGHVVVIDRIAASLAPLPASEPMPVRIRVAYVAEMQPREPPKRIAPPAPPPARRPAPARVLAADAIGIERPWDDAPIERLAKLERPPPPPEPVAGVEPPGEPAFDWPASTRLSYRLSGHYRGEVHGSATVEWIRVGARYQVHLDVSVGLPFAPLFARRMSSEGTITADGLQPARYDEETRMAFREPRRAALQFGTDHVILARGDRAARPAALQDSASQFVQIAWLLAIRPELGRPEARITLPLALPRHVLPWTYAVTGTETVYTDIGPIETLHLRPAQPPRPGDLGAEAWFAPTLRFLPVRIRIRQDDATFVDLVLARLPRIEADATAAAVPR